MKSTWTIPQQEYLDNMKNEIKAEMNQMNQKIENNHKEIKTEMNQKFDKIFKHLGIE